MARIHARVKGKSGSKRPVTSDLSFVEMKKGEVEKKVAELAKDDVKPSMIGVVLRDSFGVPSVKKITGKSVTKILEEAKVDFALPEDLNNLVVKANKLKKHLQNNTRDVHNRRSLILIESKIRRLTKYYKKTGKVANNWNYK